MRMTRRVIITATVAALLVGGLAYFQFVFKPQMIRGFITKQAPPPASVSTEVARTDTWTGQLSAIGTLVSSQGVDITTQVAGIVSDIQFDSGVDVAKGQKLVQLDIAVETADLASARATFREAEVAFSRQADLIRRAVTSEALVDTARAKRDTADAAMKRIEALIAQKSILAPFAGRLGIRKVEKGQYVSPGMVMVTLQQLDPIRVDFPMPEQAIGRLKAEMPLDIGVDAYPGMRFRGQIQSLDARVAQETRTLLIRGLVPNPDRRLLPGMFANVTVQAGEPQTVVTVPRTAVTFSLYGDSVYVVKPAAAKPGEAQAAPAKPPAAGATPSEPMVVDRRFVKVGETREDRVSILSGLSAGEQVVTGGQLKLNPGAAVRVDNSQPLTRPEQRPKQ